MVKKTKRGTHKYSVVIEFETIGKIKTFELDKYAQSLTYDLKDNLDVINPKVNSSVEEL